MKPVTVATTFLTFLMYVGVKASVTMLVAPATAEDRVIAWLNKKKPARIVGQLMLPEVSSIAERAESAVEADTVQVEGSWPGLTMLVTVMVVDIVP